MKASLLLCVCAVFLGCEGSPHGPIEGAGHGNSAPTTPIPSKALLENLDELPEPVREVEPNSTAKEAALLLPRQVLTGTIAEPKDADWFRIEAPGPSILRAEVARVGDVDLQLSLYGKKGRRLLRQVNNTSKGGGEVISNFRVEGTVFLQVALSRQGIRNLKAENKSASGEPASRDYSLVVVLNEPGDEDENEPNGSPKKARTLRQESGIRGYLNNGEDADFFRIPPPLSNAQSWVLSFLSATNSPAQIALFYGNEDRATRTRVDGGEMILIPRIRPDNKEDLYVSVTSLGGFNVSSPYRLEMLSTPLPEGALPPTEPNDVLQDSIPLALNEKGEGIIGWPGDKDWWEISGARRGLLRMEISGIPGVALRAKVVAIDGSQMGSSLGLPGESILLPNVPTTGKSPVFLALAGNQNTWNDRIPYHIQTSWRKGSGEEVEPNETLSLALARPGISLKTATMGFIGWADDIDCFHLNTTKEPNGAILTFRFRAPKSVTIQARLVDAEGQELLPSEIIPANSTGTLTTYLMPGVYGIEIRGLGGGASADAPYSLSIVH